MRLMLLFILFPIIYGADNVDIEASIFGVSYHFGHEYDYNQINYGGGLGVVLSDEDERLRFVVSGGTYLDSYDKQAIFVLGGVRYVWGDDFKTHCSLGVYTGYVKGSDNNGAAIVPVLSIGYNWIDLCATSNVLVSNSQMIAFFINMRVYRF